MLCTVEWEVEISTPDKRTRIFHHITDTIYYAETVKWRGHKLDTIIDLVCNVEYYSPDEYHQSKWSGHTTRRGVTWVFRYTNYNRVKLCNDSSDSSDSSSNQFVLRHKGRRSTGGLIIQNVDENGVIVQHDQSITRINVIWDDDCKHPLDTKCLMRHTNVT